MWKKPTPLKTALFFHSRQGCGSSETQCKHVTSIPEFVILFIFLVAADWAEKKQPWWAGKFKVVLCDWGMFEVLISEFSEPNTILRCKMRRILFAKASSSTSARLSFWLELAAMCYVPSWAPVSSTSSLHVSWDMQKNNPPTVRNRGEKPTWETSAPQSHSVTRNELSLCM